MAGCQKRADSRLLFLQRAVQLVFSMVVVVVVVQLKKAADKVSLELMATTAGRFSSAGTSHSTCWRQVGRGRDERLCDVALPGTCGRPVGQLEAISDQLPGDEV